MTTAQLVVACEKCGRYGVYAVERLWRERNDIKLTDWLIDLSADCPKRIAKSYSDWCGIRDVTGR